MTLPRLPTVVFVVLACAASWVGCGGDETSVGNDRFSSGGGDPGSGGEGALGAASASHGSSTSSGDGGGPPASSASSSASGAQCPDSGPEPNEAEAQASDLGAIDDCDSSAVTIDGVLAGDDVDWYVYHGDDALGCTVDPSREVTADGTYRICKFAACDSGDATVTCPAETTSDTSPDGLPGCCAQAGFTLGLDCPGITDAAKIFVRLDKPPAFDCVKYTLAYHY